MKIIITIITAVSLLLSCAYASGSSVEAPPALMLEYDDITETPSVGNYSWSFPTGNQGEWSDVEACGMAPTDPAVLSAFDHVIMLADEEYTVTWQGIAPDELIAFSWDIAVFFDQEHIDDYQKNPEIIIRKDGGKITLKPDRVYDFQAKWLQEEGTDKAYGIADYYLVTERLIIDDGPGMIMVGGWTPASDTTITEERKALFEKGVSTMCGGTAVPIAYLGSQVVAGTNHVFLCQSATAYPEMDVEPAFVLVYLYEDLQGDVSILNIADFDIGALCTYGE